MTALTPEQDAHVLHALAELGQSLLNSIVCTEVLGHTRLQHSISYVHDDSPRVQLALACIDGEITKAQQARAAWLAHVRATAPTA